MYFLIKAQANGVKQTSSAKKYFDLKDLAINKV